RHAQERLGFVAAQVADGRAGEIHNAAGLASVSGDAERMREVGGDRDDAELREFPLEALERRAQRIGGDVDRHVDRWLQRLQQKPGLQAFAATVFEQSAALACKARDVLEVALGDAELDARRVVLAQAADLFEEAAAGGVVEVLGRQRLLRTRETL